MVRFLLACLLTLSVYNTQLAADETFDFSGFYQESPQEQSPTEDAEPIQAELISEQTSIQPGQPFWIALKISVGEGWHTYWKEPGDIGVACSINWELPEGFQAGESLWPKPTHFKEGGKNYWGYNEDFVLLTEITPPENLAQATAPIPLSGTLQWLACNKSTCLPGESSLQVELPITAAKPKVNLDHRDLIAEARAQLTPLNWKAKTPLPAAADTVTAGEPSVPTPSSETFDHTLAVTLLLAFIGGIILNLMPCVLPVISVKILQLIKMAGESRRSMVQHGVVFTLGVLVSFWLLAGILLSLQAYGRAAGWGFQLQEPIFVGTLAAILFIFGLNLFGLFEFGTLFSAWAGQKASHAAKERTGLPAAFFGGVLATAVATPCTGPFLGSAVGLAVTLPTWGALSIFTSIGLGMSLPYLLLTAFPPLVRWLPRPGAWMVRFKEFMGFLMLGAVLWLVWVFGAQTSMLGVMALLTGFFILTVACWIYGNWSTYSQTSRTRLVSTIAAAMLVIMGAYFIVGAATQTGVNSASASVVDSDWEPYSKERLEALRAENVPVFVDFTAKWCLICQTNHYVLEVAQVRGAFKDKGVIKMLADWTKPDPEITAALREQGRNGVPLYLLYVPGEEKPEILPQLLTPEIVVTALAKLKKAD